MRRSSRDKLAIARTTLKRLDDARLRAVGGGVVPRRDDSYLDSCWAGVSCKDTQDAD